MWHSSHEHELVVLVKDRPVTEYHHEGATYIEGRNGSNYELKLRNRTNRRVLYIPSVDGLSVLDGKQAGVKSPGYVVDPYGEITITGWKVDSETAAKFEFRPHDGSYAAQSGKGVVNNGVIGVMVFPEKKAAEVFDTHFKGLTLRGDPTPYWSNNTRYGSGEASLKALRAGAATQASFSAGIASAGINSVLSQSTNTLEDTGLGTGFGEATTFVTRTVEFVRENEKNPSATLAVYYDTKKGLERRGIIVNRSRPTAAPNPFPADGCTPPPGWRK